MSAEEKLLAFIGESVFKRWFGEAQLKHVRVKAAKAAKKATS